MFMQMAIIQYSQVCVPLLSGTQLFLSLEPGMFVPPAANRPEGMSSVSLCFTIATLMIALGQMLNLFGESFKMWIL